MESSFKILLVDDQQIVLDGLKKQLNWSRFNGLICGCVSDGAEAINFLQTCRPDVIISDIKMPHMELNLPDKSANHRFYPAFL